MSSGKDAKEWDNGTESKPPPELEEKQKIEFEIERLRRETYRSVRAVDRMRISASYRLGRLFTESVFSPVKLFLLPFRTLSLIWTVGMERLGRKEPPLLNSKLDI